MDKNFFMFDIDDEIKNETVETCPDEKVQNSFKISEKTYKNDEKSNIFVAKCLKNEKSSFYEKQNGLSSQRKINSNIRNVDNLVNFDFKARNKFIQEIIGGQDDSKIHNNIIDSEVEKVIEIAQIGVIFY